LSASPSSHPALHSLPTRRSSDLLLAGRPQSARHLPTRDVVGVYHAAGGMPALAGEVELALRVPGEGDAELQQLAHPLGRLAHARSEEHTSELQSRENLVCRLLLE